jgi:purine-binding chemotaxis protein CheW
MVRADEQSVVFQLRNEFYGLDIFRVVEIIRLREITPIPKTDEHVRGLVNLRGKTIPVIDLGIRFGLGLTKDGDSVRIIVVDSENGHVGVLVDAVREVIQLSADKVEGPPAVSDRVRADFIRGVAKEDGGLITLLDLDTALAA